MARAAASSERAPADLPLWQPEGGVAAALRDDPLACHLAPYRAFGPIYRANYNGGEAVVMAGLAANEFIWANSALWDYGASGAAFREQFGDRYLTQMDGEPHRRKRKTMMAGFRPRVMAELAAPMQQILDVEIGAAAAIDLRSLCKRLVVCMASRSLVHVDLPRGFEDTIAAFEQGLLAGRRLEDDARHAWYARPDYVAQRSAVLGTLDAALDQRAACPHAADALTRMEERLDPAEPAPDRSERLHDLAMLLLAGSESTAHAILWSLLYVYSRPELQARLRLEVAEFDASRADDARAYPLLQAVVREIERLRPPFPAAVHVAKRDFSFAGVRVPAGTSVLHASTLCHFLEEIYEDPWSFRPERFLDGRSYPAKSIGLFGGGAHLCLGMPLARLQMPLALATFVRGWDVAFMPPPSFKAVQHGALTPIEPTVSSSIAPRSA